MELALFKITRTQLSLTTSLNPIWNDIFISSAMVAVEAEEMWSMVVLAFFFFFFFICDMEIYFAVAESATLENDTALDW